MTEIDEMRRAMMAMSDEGSKVFRNNVAQGVMGQIEWHRGHEPKTVTLRPGDAVVRSARVLHAGLLEGSHDVIGITPVTITPEMVGRVVGVFTSVEMKFGRKKMTTEQQRWERMVLACGGITGVAYSAAEAVALVRGFGGKA